MSGGTHSKGPTATKRHVLFALLDWGLGHATRSWPLIVAARKSGARVTVASRGASAVWLQNRMTELEAQEQLEGTAKEAPWVCLEKPGTNIRYAKGNMTLPQIALQMPKFLKSVAAERRWLEALIAHTDITHVVSDNCYGVHPPQHSIPSALITHQVAPPVPLMFRRISRAQIRRWTKAFSEVWIPDTGKGELAGALSVPSIEHHRFIGPLSRFALTDGTGLAPTSDALVASAQLVGMVSGPEPQRQLMEEALVRCFKKDGRSAVIFSGKPQGSPKDVGNIRIIPHAPDSQIRHALLQANCIICRSGYSSLMDLAALQLQAVLVPTPGQPEQEYLAQHWQKRWGWTKVHQGELAEFRPEFQGDGTPLPLPRTESSNWSWLEDWLNK